MNEVVGINFEPKYKRDNGLVVLDTDNPPLPESFTVHETSVVRLPDGEIAGNHKHLRQEAYFCLDEGVDLHWIDANNQTHIEPMVEQSQNSRLFVIPPHIPHAVVNVSGRDVTLVGYADSVLENAVAVEVASKSSDNDRLSEGQISQVVSLLSKLKPGFLPFGIFHEVTRLVATPIIEVTPLCLTSDGKVGILLLKREADDPVWPDQLHVPGTVVRASDTPGSFDDPLKRIFSKELTDTQISEPVFVRNILHDSGRGMEASQIFWVEVKGEPGVGEFFDADNLPASIVKSQLDFISDAVVHFKRAKLSES